MGVSSYVDFYKDVEAYYVVCVGVCTESSLYVDYYNNLEVYDRRKVDFCVVVLGTCIRDQRKARLF